MTISTQRHAQMSTSYPKSNIFMAAKDSPVAPWKRALNYLVPSRILRTFPTAS